jgi:hypothetical protein
VPHIGLSELYNSKPLGRLLPAMAPKVYRLGPFVSKPLGTLRACTVQAPGSSMTFLTQ